MKHTESVTQVKICGIRNLDDARCAAEAGASFLGFVFVPSSPRFVTPDQAAAITQAIRAEFGPSAPRAVGVFVNEGVDQVRQVIDAAHLDLAQLHGDERPEEVEQLYPHAFKAIRPETAGQAREAMEAYRDVFLDDQTLPQLLLDAYHPEQSGGTGIPGDLTVAQPVARDCRLLLAGGLTPETVRVAIEVVRPWGVDVSSGVERARGIKDQGRIRAFIQAVRRES